MHEAAAAAPHLPGSPEGQQRTKQQRAPRLSPPASPVLGRWDVTGVLVATPLLLEQKGRGIVSFNPPHPLDEAVGRSYL